MLLDPQPDVRTRQLAEITNRLGPPTAQASADLAAEVDALAPELRLPVLSLAAPLLAARPPTAVDALVTTLDALARADGVVTLFEYCLTRLVASYLRDARNPPGRSTPGRGDVASARGAALAVLTAVAAEGNSDAAAAEHAFAAAAAQLVPGATAAYRPAADPWRALDDAWGPLDALDPRHKQAFVDALVVAVRDDGVLTLNEAELLRTACGLLHCPLPAFVA
jgi:hypothetical protein